VSERSPPLDSWFAGGRRPGRAQGGTLSSGSLRRMIVPAQDGGGGDGQLEASVCGYQPGQSGDQSSVGPAHPGSWSAPPEYGKFLAQDQDLDVLGGVGAGEQDHRGQESEDRQVDQPQRHRRITPGLPSAAKRQVSVREPSCAHPQAVVKKRQDTRQAVSRNFRTTGVESGC
jgi:hypothetical protein